MELNDFLTKQVVFSKILLQSGNKELPKDLKVKIMQIRNAYKKIKRNYDSEINNYVLSLQSEEFKILNAKTNRTDEEENRYQELVNQINSDYFEFLIKKGQEKVSLVADTISESEYNDIVDVNSGNDVEINGNLISAADFLEMIYELFVC